MLPPPWQLGIAIVVVAWAAGYVIWRGWHVVRRKPGGCSGCSVSAAEQPRIKPLVELDSLAKSTSSDSEDSS